MKTAAPDETLSREDYIQRHLAFNLFAFLVDAGGWWLGMSFLSTQTIVPYFVKRLGGGDLLIGLIPALCSLGFMLPQLFIAPLTERRRIQKWAVLNLAWFERLPFGLLALFTFLLAKSSPSLLLTLCFVCLAANAFTMGANTPGYATMLTKAIPTEKRGRLWGISGSIGSLIGLAGAFFSRMLLERYGMPLGFTYCFLVGFVVLVVSVGPLGLVREPDALETPQRAPFRHHWRDSWGLLGKHPGFRRLLLFEWYFALASMAPAFYTVHAIERHQAGSGEVGAFNIALIAASVVGGFLWGHLSDRYGNRKTLLSSTGFKIAAPLLALLVPSLGWYPAVFFLSGMADSGFNLGNFSILLEYAGESKVATFQGVRGLTVMAAWTLFPLLGGWMAKTVGYTSVFLLSSAAGFAALLVLRGMPDPRHRSQSEGFSLETDPSEGEMELSLAELEETV